MVQMKQGSRFESPSPRTFAANRLIRRSAVRANGVHYNPVDHMHGIIVLKKLLSLEGTREPGPRVCSRGWFSNSIHSCCSAWGRDECQHDVFVDHVDVDSCGRRGLVDSAG
jgi:hypothetical protein